MTVTMRIDRNITDPAYWNRVLALTGNPVIKTISARRLIVHDHIIGCPYGKTKCHMAGASCENADACPTGAITLKN